MSGAHVPVHLYMTRYMADANDDYSAAKAASNGKLFRLSLIKTHRLSIRISRIETQPHDDDQKLIRWTRCDGGFTRTTAFITATVYIYSDTAMPQHNPR